jgi:hypothetical protein
MRGFAPRAASTWASSARGNISPNGSYSTNFPLTENPISEGGAWENTISGTFNNPIITASGRATGPNSSGTNDSIARLTGTTYGRDQIVTGVAYVGGASGAAEIELHTRVRYFPGSPDTVQLYEFDILRSANAIALMKWDGSQGQVTQIATGNISGIVDGDVFVASSIGPANNTVHTITQNGSQIFTFTETSGAFVLGNPGMGLDAGSPANGANLGWKSYSVTTS